MKEIGKITRLEMHMYLNRPELWAKLNSLINRYGGRENFVAHMDEWPRTIKELVFSSEKLIIRLGLAEPIPDPLDDEKVMWEWSES
jgi:hypothetical protein